MRDVPSEILVASVLVTLRPVVRGPSLRRVVVFAPDESGSRYVTIGINVPRRAQRGQYRLAARLIDEEQQTVLARFADPVAVGVR